MEKLTVFYVIIPIIVAYLTLEYRYVWITFLRKASESYDDKKEIVIGVLSARDHFMHRQAIRQTWMGHVKTNESLSERVDIKFIVGQRACEIPIMYRTDPYTCEQYQLSVPDKVTDLLAVSEVARVEPTPGFMYNFALHTLAFKMHHPVILSKLGVHDGSLQHKLAVRLLDAATQNEIVSTVFTKENPGVLIKGFRYKAVEPYLLPQGFDGFIVAEPVSSGNQELPVTSRDLGFALDGAAGVVEFLEPRLEPTHESHYTDPRAAGAARVPVVSFIYTVHDVETLKTFVGNQKSREAEWHNMTLHHQEELRAEVMRYDDVILVDVTDVYRNVPFKLVRFYEWLVSTREFELAMKTDDDCFVDVDRLLARRDADNITGTGLWWGRFRQAWAVEHYGKWTELQYPSIAYPAFACGVGSLVSADMVDWVAGNAQALNMFQGEDVSLGIWLSAVAPKMVDDPTFQCEKQCLSNMVAMPDLGPQELLQLWADRTACGDPCGCS